MLPRLFLDADGTVPSLLRLRQYSYSWRLITPRITREQSAPHFASRARSAREVDALVMFHR